MSKYAFIVPPLTGHVNPTLSIGEALLNLGHEVSWISLDPELEHKLPPGGKLLLIAYGQDDQDKKESEEYLDIITKKIVYGIESIKFLYEEVLIPLNRHCYPGILNLLMDHQPDLVINDQQMFAGAIAARKLNMPYATTVTAPAAIKVMDELPKVHQWETEQIIALQKEFGIMDDQSITCSPELTMVLTSSDFFGEMELPPNYQFVGPVISRRTRKISFDWGRLSKKTGKKILISIGTTFDHEHKKEFFAKVIGAFKDEDLEVVVVSDPDLFNNWPNNFIVQKEVPQLELLKHLDAIVCHGGHNTVCESLTNSLAMVVIPIAYDQSHVAGRVVRVGAGLRLNFNRFKSAHLNAAVHEVLNNPSFAAAANKISASFKAAGGIQKAVELLENLIERNIEV